MNPFLAAVVVVLSALYIASLVQGRILRRKLAKAAEDAIAARKQFEDAGTELVVNAEKASAEFQRTVAADAEAQQLENERIRLHYQAEAARVGVELAASAQKALEEAEKALSAEAEAQRLENDRIRQHYQAEASRVYAEISATLAETRVKLSILEKVQGLAQDEAAVRATLSIAVKEAEDLRTQAVALLAEAKSRSSAERSAAVEKAREIRQHADVLLYQANAQSSRILEEAHKKALEIGGDGYLALREKVHLEEAVIAIRNIIEGYGDKYIVPTHSLIDDLAADFGHTEAGKELATARDQVRRMVAQGLAAQCDYVETIRRDTAVRFVTDAFNGRVESILGEAKHDNYGTLAQELRDAFNLVNLNGEAFRNARITPSFLDARLAELKWTVIVRELKLKELEEQRRIREQIREEEKARKEYEKAMRDAQREEDIIREAFEKARHEAEAASAEQRALLELQMAELSERLAAAEAKNQRALSMAQQTRKGNVYIISNVGSFGEGMLSGLRINQVNLRKEFFRVPLDDIRNFITERKIEAAFTLTADAHEYRESQVISKMTPAQRDQYRMSRLASMAE
ncbi:MAG: hypothetical protein K0R17_3146 [Rariglobus sp.]|nr:hypothetical protein [Rariglobus sp.]